MTGTNAATRLLYFVPIALTSLIAASEATISDRRLCFDSKCSVPISEATTLMTYRSNDPAIMSFENNVDVTVFSKSAGKRQDLWGVEINGQRGYVPWKMIKEKRVWKRTLIHEVPTEQTPENDTGAEAAPSSGDEKESDVPPPSIPEPSRVSPSFEVHDGTTIPVAMGEEAVEPSYSTAALLGDKKIEEHPVLSVHPNVAVKNEESTSDAVNHAGTEDLGEKISNESDPEMPENTKESDETKVAEDIANGSNEADEIANFPTLESVDETKTSEEASAGEDNPEKDSVADPNKADEPLDQAPIETEIVLEQGEENSISESQPAENESIAAPEQPLVYREEPVTPETLEEPRQEQQLDGPDEKTVEAPVEAPVKEPLKVEPEEKSPVVEQIPPESPKVDDSGENAETGSSQEISPEGDKQVESSSIPIPEARAENEIDGSANDTVEDTGSVETNGPAPKNDSQESENVETSATDAEKPPGEVEEKPEVKSSEETPPSINILNPLLNRLSVLSARAKDERATSQENVEPKTSESVEVLGAMPHDEPTIEPESIEQNDEKPADSVDNNNEKVEIEVNKSVANSVVTGDVAREDSVQPGIYGKDDLSGFSQGRVAEETANFNGFPANRNLLNVGNGLRSDQRESEVDSPRYEATENSLELEKEKEATTDELPKLDEPEITTKAHDHSDLVQDIVTETADSCLIDSTCQKPEAPEDNHSFVREGEDDEARDENLIVDVLSIGRNYWETLTYLVVTAFTTLLFSLGYYYIENARRDGHYIAKINQLEKQLLVCSKECTVLEDTLKSTKTKLDSIEDESFGSNEMVASLKADLEASKTAKAELEDQVAMLEKELESATEAGLELERMLREVLSANNEDNPLAQSVEDLQTRLNAQQAANEALTNALHLKAQENENLNAELRAMSLKSEQLEVEVSRLNDELKQQHKLKNSLEQTLKEKVGQLEKQVKDTSAEKINLRKQLKGKEMELKDLHDVVNQMNTSNLDFEKLYNVSRVKAEASQLMEERDELKIRLSEVEGAHQLLEEHVKLINEEVSSLSEQCRLAEKAKRDAETRVEVLSNFFKEKEAQRQKEEAIWLEKQGEVSSTVERLHAMQNEIHNYKQQIEMLKREILDQEREYKNQMATLETKSHENWVVARQNERRLEESKAEASQLRNRLTLIEKNINEMDPEAKLHRLEANGETPTSPQLFIGAEASSSPIMFGAGGGVPLPPPPSYLYGGHPVPPFMPPLPPPPQPSHPSSALGSPYEVGQRPPPLGGRLSSPPPLPSVNSSRYDDHRSPPPIPTSILQPFGHRGFQGFPNDRTPPPPPPHSLPPPLAGRVPWAEEPLSPPPPPASLRNPGFQSQQRQHHHHRDNERRARNHKGSLHSSGESLDKNL